MSMMVQVYMKKDARIRLKALAYLDNRTLSGYINEMARKEVQKIDTTRYNRAVEAVTAAPDDPA